MNTPAPGTSFDRDYFLEAHQAAERHLQALFQELEYEETPFSDHDSKLNEDFDAAGPFCGCETCVIREALHAAWPLLRLAALAGVE